MIGNPAAAYLGGGLHQQLPTFICGPGGPVTTVITISPVFCPTHLPGSCWPPRTFAPLHCSFVCGDLAAIGRTVATPDCLQVPVDFTRFPGPGPLMHAMGAPQQDCKNVMWTAGCTFAGAQPQAEVGCKDVLWTAGCTFGAAQAAADCKDVLWTAGCTFAGAQQAQQAAVGCKDVLWTAGCTFGGAQAHLPQTLLPPCNVNIQTAMTHCFICPPDPCRQILATRLCTLVGPFPDVNAQAGAGQDCKNVMWTAGCTFAGAQQLAAAPECGKVLTTLACTLAAAKGEECGSVLTTLVCTLAKAGTADSPMCITVLTHVPTWCAPDTAADGCKHVLWTAGCTFAGAQQAAECGKVLTTLACTLAAAGKEDAEQCGNVLTTLACTLSADRLPGAEGNLDCKDVLWTAGCTFQGLAKGERCGDVLTTLACTLAAAPAEGQDAKADCKDVLWTAGCTFAVTPSERDDGCKVVAWTAGCTF